MSSDLEAEAFRALAQKYKERTVELEASLDALKKSGQQLPWSKGDKQLSAQLTEAQAKADKLAQRCAEVEQEALHERHLREAAEAELGRHEGGALSLMRQIDDLRLEAQNAGLGRQKAEAAEARAREAREAAEARAREYQASHSGQLRQITELQKELAELQSKLRAVGKNSSDRRELEAQLADARNTVDELNRLVQSQRERIEELEAVRTSAERRASAAEKELGEIRPKLAQLPALVRDSQGYRQLKKDYEGLQQRATEAQALASRLEDELAAVVPEKESMAIAEMYSKEADAFEEQLEEVREERDALAAELTALRGGETEPPPGAEDAEGFINGAEWPWEGDPSQADQAKLRKNLLATKLPTPVLVKLVLLIVRALEQPEQGRVMYKNEVYRSMQANNGRSMRYMSLRAGKTRLVYGYDDRHVVVVAAEGRDKVYGHGAKNTALMILKRSN